MAKNTPFILVVDDVIDTTNVLKLLLEFEGFEVIVAYDGEEGLEKALNNDLDGMILDLNLPKLHGLEVLEELMKQKPKLNVIILSAYIEGGNEERARSLGAYDVLKKPFDSAHLIRRIKDAAGVTDDG
jgi:DNA-binding response OmpR family regulator